MPNAPAGWAVGAGICCPCCWLPPNKLPGTAGVEGFVASWNGDGLALGAIGAWAGVAGAGMPAGELKANSGGAAGAGVEGLPKSEDGGAGVAGVDEDAGLPKPPKSEPETGAGAGALASGLPESEPGAGGVSFVSADLPKLPKSDPAGGVGGFTSLVSVLGATAPKSEGLSSFFSSMPLGRSSSHTVHLSAALGFCNMHVPHVH